MAAMTRHGFDAATAATQVKDQIVHLINPSAAAEKTITALSKASGVDLVSAFTATGVHTLGLKGIMDLTTTAMNKVGLSADQQTAEWLKLVPNIRGGAASFVLAGRGAQDFNDILHDIDTSTGVTDEAFQRIETTLNFQWGTATNRLRELSITIGNLLKPALTDVLSHVNDFIASVQSLPESVLQGIVVVTGLAGAAALLVGGFILLAPLGAAIGTAFGAITGILISFAPWVLVVVGAFLALKAAWDSDLGSIKEIADRFSNLGDILQAALSGEVVAAWGGFVEDIKTLDPAIRTVIDNIGDFIGRALELASVLGGQLKSVIDTQLGPALENIGNFMAQNVGPAFDIVAGAVGFLKDTLGGVVTNGLRPLQVIIDAFRANPEALPGFFTSLGDSLVTLGGRVQTVAPVLGSLASLFGAINNLIGTVVQVGFSALIGLFTDVLIPNLDKLRPVLIALAVPLAVAFGPFIAFFKFITDNAGAISKAIDQIAGSINALATAIGTLPANFANLPGVAGATSAAGTALNATSGAAQGALNAGSQLLNNGVNLTINGVTINNAGDLNSFTQAVADAIAGASRRVGPPVSNGGFPAIEGQFT
jgi:hypothetical protein